MAKVWHFGNTTVRNPLRIRDGLIVLKQSNLNGNLIGKEKERLFAEALDDAGVVSINRQRDYSDVGRKWRSCFSQLGFITHKFDRSLKEGETDDRIREVQATYEVEGLISTKPYEITANGKRLIKSENIIQQNECMARALLAYQIPSGIEPETGLDSFSPFIFILEVISELEKYQDMRGLSKVEMCLVETCKSHDKFSEILNKIKDFRNKHDNVVGRVRKKRIEKDFIDEIADAVGVKSISLIDYADVNFRYPRLTGLLSLKGRRLVINKDKKNLVESILKNKDLISISDINRYLHRLWNGAFIPTDDKLNAISEIKNLKEKLIILGFKEEELPAIDSDQDVADINIIRMDYEKRYKLLLEEIFANEQSSEENTREIIGYLKKLNGQAIDDDLEIEIYDNPSFLEWAVWRAFLAINDLKNKAHEARRFKVDQDFYPVSCASGGGADMIFEFEDYVLVVEVTLTTSSRQEAAEGEPVRRHVAKEKLKYNGKAVYGVFLAKAIDNNTAETFRIGVWYNNDDADFINIVPLTLSQFIKVMEKFENDKFKNDYIRVLLDNCLIPRNAHAPAWKKEIESIVTRFI